MPHQFMRRFAFVDVDLARNLYRRALAELGISDNELVDESKETSDVRAYVLATVLGFLMRGRCDERVIIEAVLKCRCAHLN